MTTASAAAAQALERPPCPRCGSGDARPICEGRDYLHELPGTFGAVECVRCGLAFESPRPGREALADYYPSDYAPHETIDSGSAYSRAFHGFLQRRFGYPPPGASAANRRDWRALPFIASWFAKTELVPYYVEGGRVLEIGCGSGNRLRILQQLGWRDLHGIEMVPAAAEAARKRGFDVVCGSAEDVLARHADASFDVIIASMVLEHMYDPFGVLALMAKKLRPGGEILLSTVIRDSIDEKIYGPYWGGYDFPRHLVYFRKSDVVDAIGGEIGEITIVHQPAPQDFVRSSTWRRGERRLFDRAVLLLSRMRAVMLVCCMTLAWARLTCRISIRGRKQK